MTCCTGDIGAALIPDGVPGRVMTCGKGAIGTAYFSAGVSVIPASGANVVPDTCGWACSARSSNAPDNMRSASSPPPHQAHMGLNQTTRRPLP